MAKTDFKSVDEYIATFPEDTRDVLNKIRAAIRKAVPDAEEEISYQIPAYKLHGWVIYFSAYTSHYSLSCPPPFTIFEVFKKQLAPYEVSKSAIKFPLNKPVPVKLIGEIAKLRAKENLAREGKREGKTVPKKEGFREVSLGVRGLGRLKPLPSARH